MNHLFITRLAVELGGKANPLRARNRAYVDINDRLQDIIKYWLDHATKFYTQQTVDQPFSVYLVYSTKYRDVVTSFNYPKWVQLIIDKNFDRLNNRQLMKSHEGKRLSVSRVDADDWYSNDLFEYLDQDHETTWEKYLTAHLYKRVRIYDRLGKRVSTPAQFSSPGFCSYTIPRFNTDMSPLPFKMWPHGNIKRRPHLSIVRDYCMQSVGCNVVNKWRPYYKVDTDNLSRFYIPGN